MTGALASLLSCDTDTVAQLLSHHSMTTRMLWWDRKVLSLANANAITIYLYSRYVHTLTMKIW